MTTKPQRKRPVAQKAANLVAAETEALMNLSVTEDEKAEVALEPSFAGKSPRNNQVVNLPEGKPRISFDRGSQSEIAPRKRTSGAFEARGLTSAVSDLRERMSPPANPGDLPIAIIDQHGFVLPFSANNPMDRVILAQIPGITFVYTESDYRMVKEHNDRMIRERRFEETLQGAKLRLPPEAQTHNFRNGREVVAGFIDETMLNPAAVQNQFDQWMG